MPKSTKQTSSTVNSVARKKNMNALDKVIAVIEAFLPEGEELRLIDLARITGMNKSTTYVTAQALVERGYLTQSGNRGAYFLGVRFIELANVVSHKLSVVDVAQPFMITVNEETHETIELVVRDGDFCTVISTVQTKRLLSASGTGKWAARLTLHNTACGKVLAAYTDPVEWQSLREKISFSQDTPKTITDIDTFEQHLETVRMKGFAIDNEEVEVGIRSVAAPVYNERGVVIAAVHILGPTNRITNKKMKSYKSMIIDCAQQISQAMGYGFN